MSPSHYQTESAVMAEWGIFVLEWALHRTGDSLLDTVGKALRQDPLVRDITMTVQKWVDSLPANAKIASHEPIFPSHLPDSELGDRPYLLVIRETLRRKEIPSQEMWSDALIEQWDFVNRTVQSPYGIFAIPRDVVEPQLKNLARELALVCATDEDSFRRFVYTQFEQGARKRGGALQLLSEHTEYYIPDSDDNRNVVKGATRDAWSYTVIRASLVMEAYSDWEVHESLLFLLVKGDWRSVTLFGPDDCNWPLTGPSVRRYLSQQAASVNGSEVSTNLTQLELPAGKSKQLRLIGYLMTSSSLQRQARYPLLMLFHIKTTYAALLIEPDEDNEPCLLGHTLLGSGDGPIDQAAQQWAGLLLRDCTEPNVATKQSHKVILSGP